MQFALGRQSRIVLLLLLMGVVAYLMISGRAARKTLTPRHIPPEGIAENDTKGRVPGDPALTTKHLKLIKDAVETYRSRNGGKAPKEFADFFVDWNKDSKAYGFATMSDALKAFHHPDARYADSPAMRKMVARGGNVMPYTLYTRRPNGDPVGGPKPAGTRDPIASTDIHFHRNLRHFKGDRTTIKPTGYHMVLWDDGSISRIKYDDILYYRTGPGEHKTAFPGQAGIPPDAISFDEFQRTVVGKGPAQ